MALEHGTSEQVGHLTGRPNVEERGRDHLFPQWERRAKGEVIKPKEIGGPKGPEPTRYGDWERNGRCIDF